MNMLLSILITLAMGLFSFITFILNQYKKRYGMNYMIYKLCRRCKTPIVHPLTYCSKCKEIQEEQQLELQRERDRRYNKKRDPKYKQFYCSKEWRILKEKVLQDYQYRCQHKGCGKLAVDVHHIKYIQTEEGWELRLDYNNCIPLCIDHHNYIHGRFQRKKVI